MSLPFLFLAMFYVVMAILSSAILTTNFKLYDRLGVDTFQAIVFNYITCVLFSFMLVGNWSDIMSIIDRPWFSFSFLLGSSFLIGFNLLGRTVQHIGITVTTIFQKMSMIITIILAFLLFAESTHTLKLIGIAIAILSILLTYEKKKGSKTEEISTKHYMYALAVFFMSGIIDYCFYYVKKVNLVIDDDMLFTGTTFGVAAIWGIVFLFFGWVRKKFIWKRRNVTAGIVLGIPNVFSVFFILKSLSSGIEGTILFPILNVGILLLSALIGLLFFQEHLSKKRATALCLALFAIVLIGYSAYV